MITSVDNPTIKKLAKFQQKKYRDLEKKFIVEGEHLVLEALKANVISEVYSTIDHPKFRHATKVADHVMKKITDTKNPPKIIALCHQKISTNISDKVLILEHIQDPGNLGTLLRSALAFGFETIVLDQTVDPYNPKVLRGTQGAIFKLSLLFEDTVSFKEKNKKHTLYATHVKDKKSSLSKPIPPFALILGNEGQGLKDETIAIADYTISIPTETVESLNVAIAGSILMHTLGGKSFITL
ncbi:MAG: TrmH family RNA methyltransferase [Candidatus Izemoplasmataceae bacterium]|jgi:RNA methyltransferase, TrmH family